MASREYAHSWFLWIASCSGLVLLLLGLHTFWPSLQQWLMSLNTIQLGLLASLIAGLFTAVGAIPIFFIRRFTRGIEDSLMGFGAGVMLAATAFELILPAMDMTVDEYPVLIAASIIGLGVALGGGTILLLHRYVPHEHFVLGPQSGADPLKVKRVFLFIFAIALHNLPEGFAVGVGFGGENLGDGVALAVGIGLQNMPEGLVVAIALMSLGYSRSTAFWVTLATGLVQPLGGLIGAVAVAMVEAIMPWALAFAGGAMLFVISHEIIPESHREGHEGKATLGVLIGFIVMIAIDMILG